VVRFEICRTWHLPLAMPNCDRAFTSSMRPTDPNQLGKLIVELSVGEKLENPIPADSPAIHLHEAAV
jgi:hypothetical protein